MEPHWDEKKAFETVGRLVGCSVLKTVASKAVTWAVQTVVESDGMKVVLLAVMTAYRLVDAMAAEKAGLLVAATDIERADPLVGCSVLKKVASKAGMWVEMLVGEMSASELA